MYIKYYVSYSKSLHNLELEHIFNKNRLKFSLIILIVSIACLSGKLMEICIWTRFYSWKDKKIATMANISTPLIKIIWVISKSMSICPPLNLIKRTTLGFPWLVTCSVATKLRRSSRLQRFLSKDLSLISSFWFNSSCPRIFEDFRLKIMNIFGENLITFRTKLFEKIGQF